MHDRGWSRVQWSEAFFFFFLILNYEYTRLHWWPDKPGLWARTRNGYLEPEMKAINIVNITFENPRQNSSILSDFIYDNQVIFEKLLPYFGTGNPERFWIITHAFPKCMQCKYSISWQHPRSFPSRTDLFRRQKTLVSKLHFWLCRSGWP